MVDILFLIDIIVNFLTEYTDTSSGDQIRNPAKIAKRYILSVFMFDLASCIPFISSLFFGKFVNKKPKLKQALSLLRIFKLIRLRKISEAISQMKSSKELKTQLKRLFVILDLCILMHV